MSHPRTKNSNRGLPRRNWRSERQALAVDRSAVCVFLDAGRPIRRGQVNDRVGPTERQFEFVLGMLFTATTAFHAESPKRFLAHFEQGMTRSAPDVRDWPLLAKAESSQIAAMATCHKDGFATISQYTASIARKAGYPSPSHHRW